jgi:hypothetical protein
LDLKRSNRQGIVSKMWGKHGGGDPVFEIEQAAFFQTTSLLFIKYSAVASWIDLRPSDLRCPYLTRGLCAPKFSVFSLKPVQTKDESCQQKTTI